MSCFFNGRNESLGAYDHEVEGFATPRRVFGVRA
jgi:hypothetical protein